MGIHILISQCGYLQAVLHLVSYLLSSNGYSYNTAVTIIYIINQSYSKAQYLHIIHMAQFQSQIY